MPDEAGAILGDHGFPNLRNRPIHQLIHRLELLVTGDFLCHSGFLAAHWGNDQFAAPGDFADAHEPERPCAETVLAIAEHDNGWWEWEAIPERGDLDDLPRDLADVLKNQQKGMNRWRLGLPRFSEEHPCVSLLISFHAYRLYAL